MIRLPGLVDPHVHLREPGATHKEDFDTGTAAALAGGFTIVLAMPNTDPPLTDAASCALSKSLAAEKARCDYGLYLGAGPDNTASAHELADQVCGMKIYLDQTFGPLRLDNLETLYKHFAAWPTHKPIAVHAEGNSVAAAILTSSLTRHPVHISHVSRAEEILLIRRAKEAGIRVSCEVTPHHLFLTSADLKHLPQGRSEVRPRLTTRADQDALWENMDVIDCIATDHAPHTQAEKDGENPPPGFPGLETSLALMLNAVRAGRISLEQVVEKMADNPRRIFGLPTDDSTWIEVHEHARWEVRAQEMHSRCGWTPFEGMQLYGRVQRVVMRNETVYEDGSIFAAAGSGRDLFA